MADNSKALVLSACGMVAMFVSIFVCYILPLLIFSRRNRRLQGNDFTAEEENFHHWSHVNLSNQLKKYKLKRLLSYCNCVSAGVFLGVCFLNLIPCVEEEFAKLIKDFPTLQKYFGSFPLGQFSVICGLFLVLLSESLLGRCFKSNQTHSHSPSSLSVPILYLDEESAVCCATILINFLRLTNLDFFVFFSRMSLEMTWTTIKKNYFCRMSTEKGKRRKRKTKDAMHQTGHKTD